MLSALLPATSIRRRVASELRIPKAYGSYEELLADPEIEAVYNPFLNHLHVPWSIRAAEAGKHVLCEKPIGLSVAECRTLIDARNRIGANRIRSGRRRDHRRCGGCAVHLWTHAHQSEPFRDCQLLRVRCRRLGAPTPEQQRNG